MKTSLLARRFIQSVLCLLFALSLTLAQLSAQNPGVQEIIQPDFQLFSHQTTPISVTINNQSTMPANGVQVQMQVLNNVMMPVFFYQTVIPFIPPMGMVTVSSMPSVWYPNPPGNYLVVVQIFANPDTDPSNNMLSKPVNAVPQPQITMGQVDMLHPYQINNSTYGLFCITYPPVVDPLFVNVMAELVGSGTTLWVVRNLPLLPFVEEQAICYWYDLRLFGLDEGDNLSNLSFSMRLDNTTLPAGFTVPLWQPVVLDDPDFDVLSLNGAETVVTPPLIFTYPTFSSTQQLTWLYRGCTVPNIDLDSTGHPPTVAYSGDWNACGPAAAANSIQWLEDTHPSIPDDGKTHRQKMESLSGHMGGNTNGVTTTALVQGKLAYIDEHKLPIHVKYQSVFVTAGSIASPNGSYGHSAENKGGTAAAMPPTWEFLKAEMEAGEDVEIMFGWYDAAGVRHGGHWVTVTGVSENTNFKGIYVKDDSDQKGPGGTRQTYLNWVTDGPWSRLVGFDGPNNNCWVESVVSESYDPTITFFAFDFGLDMISWSSPFVTPDPLKSFFSFSFPPSTENMYMNMLANLPNGSPVWIARNVLLPPRDTIETVALWIDLADLGLLPNQSADTIEIKVGVDTLPWQTSFFDVFYELSVDIDTVTYEIGIGSLETTPAVIPFVTFPLSLFDSLLATTFVYRGCEVPNIDLDSIANNPTTMPGYAGDKNACGPAAAANSLQWLEDTHPAIPNTGTTHREKLKELSDLMDRANNGGVHRKDFIEAKLAFIDKYKLPIHVKFQGFRFDANDIASPDTLYGHSADNQNASAFAKPQWDWLVQEMENGEDVELEFGYYDENGIRRGGHWITVTGVTEVGGVKSVYFKDDTRQRSPGGMRHECTRWVDHIPSGFSYLDDLSGAQYTCVVESVVSESYDPTITFCPDDLTLDQDPIPSGTYSASGTIYLSGRIASGSNVILSAPNIKLISNFVLELGGTLTTNPTGCGN